MSDLANLDPTNGAGGELHHIEYDEYNRLADAPGSVAGGAGAAADVGKADSSRSLLARANSALIKYPRFKELHKNIRRCQELSRIAGEAQCMVLEGQTGAGKSTLVREYVKAFPREESDEGTRVPVLYLETPNPATVKGMAAFMLESLGDPAAHKGTLWSMNSRLVKLIRACEVELVILDDFHHLVDAETEHILVTVSEWLKVLIKETGIPFLVVGIVGRVEQVLKANAQLSRLFASREVLQPFHWDAADPKGSVEFIQFVRYAEAALGLPVTTHLGRRELLSLLYQATDGIVANIMNLLRYAQYNALDRGSEHIGLVDLSWAYNERLAKHLSKPNSFAEAATEVKEPFPLADSKKATTHGAPKMTPITIPAMHGSSSDTKKRGRARGAGSITAGPDESSKSRGSGDNLNDVLRAS